MNVTINPVAGSRRYSLSRVWRFASYCMPRLGKQMLFYAIASLICMFLSLIRGSESMQTAMFAFIWTLVPFLYYCTPLVFAKGVDSRIVDRLVPVSAAERMTFYYLYILVILPAILFLPVLAGAKIYMMSPSVQTPGTLALYELKFSNLGMLSCINFLGGILVCTMCFLCVERPRFNRLLWGVVAIFATNFFLGIFGAVLTGTEAFKAGLRDGMEGRPAIEPDSTQLVERTLTALSNASPMTVGMTALLAIMIIIVALLTYQTLKRRNL